MRMETLGAVRQQDPNSLTVSPRHEGREFQKHAHPSRNVKQRTKAARKKSELLLKDLSAEWTEYQEDQARRRSEFGSCEIVFQPSSRRRHSVARLQFERNRICILSTSLTSHTEYGHPGNFLLKR